jgi:hypothetical protein
VPFGSNSSSSYTQPQTEPVAVGEVESVEKLNEPTPEEIGGNVLDVLLWFGESAEMQE